MLVDTGDSLTTSPRIFTDADDGAWFVMLRRVSGVNEVHARRYDLSTKKWGNETRLDGDGGDASDLILDGDAYGNALVAWQDRRVADDVSIQAVSYSSKAGSWSAAESLVTISTDTFRGLQLAVSPHGGGAVFWGEQTIEPILDSANMPSSGIVHTTLKARSLAGDTWGETGTAWERADPTFNWATVPAQGFDFGLAKPVFADATRLCAFFSWNGKLSTVSADRNRWGDATELIDEPASVASAALLNGTVQTLWTKDGALFESSNARESDTWSSPAQLHQGITPEAYNLRLIAAADGSALDAAATWTSEHQVYVTTLAGGTWQEPVQLDHDAFFNLNPGGGQPASQIAIDGAGRAAVVAGYFGLAMAQSQGGEHWKRLDIPSSDGKWTDVQLAVSAMGIVVIAAVSEDGYGGPVGDGDHLYAFLGR